MRACQLLQGIQGLLGFSLLNHTDNSVHKHHHRNDHSIADFMKQKGDNSCGKKHIYQRIIQLLQKGFHHRLFPRFLQFILPVLLITPRGFLFCQSFVYITVQLYTCFSDALCLKHIPTPLSCPGK